LIALDCVGKRTGLALVGAAGDTRQLSCPALVDGKWGSTQKLDHNVWTSLERAVPDIPIIYRVGKPKILC